METNNYYNNGTNLSSREPKYRYLTAKVEKRITISICVLIALCSLLVSNYELIFIYLFGMVFFFAGLFIGLKAPVFGLLFLVTHGGSGLFIMILSFLGGLDNELFDFKNFFNNPVFSDGGVPSNLKFYLGTVATIFIISLLYTIIHNFSSTMKEDHKHMIIILAF